MVSRARRFWLQVRAKNGCLEWIGAIHKNGYATFWTGQRRQMAHRWAWEEVFGAVPAGLQLDHLRRNRRCVKVEHLEPVTPRENLLRGVGPTAQKVAQTHCKRGHPLSGDNLYRDPQNNTRKCRQCRRLTGRIARERRLGIRV